MKAISLGDGWRLEYGGQLDVEWAHEWPPGGYTKGDHFRRVAYLVWGTGASCRIAEVLYGSTRSTKELLELALPN